MPASKPLWSRAVTVHITRARRRIGAAPLAKPPAKKPTEANRVAVAENWKTIEDRERLETIERQRKARK